MLDIVGKIDESKARKINVWPCNSNRASEAGHECERHLVYMRTRWQEKLLHDLTLQYIFDEGKWQEEAILTTLKEAGVNVIEQQRPFEWKEYRLTGHIDGKILDNGEAIPFEIKGFSNNNYEKINSVEDMKKSKYPYMRRYPSQIYLYLLMDNKEDGLFILKNKANGKIKTISVHLDYEYAERILQKLDRVNKHVQAGTLPDRNIDEATCKECGFRHICLPDRNFGEGIEIMENADLEIKLNRREALKSFADEYDDLDREIKAAVKEKPQLVIGNWYISGKWIEKNMPAKEATTQKYWQSKILKTDTVKGG